MRKTGIFLSLIATLMLVSFAFASWKGTGLRLGITTQGSNTSFTQSVSQNTLDVSNGTYSSLAVGSANVLKVDTSGSNVDIQGFSGGYDGQVIQVAVVDNSNSLNLRNSNSSGTQQLYLQGASDLTISSYGGATLVCNGTAWFEVDD